MRHNIYFIVIVILASGAFLVWSSVLSAHSGAFVVNFFDIGQGDAALIEGAGNFQILIDGGPDNSVLAKLGHAMPQHDRTIELVVMSHPDKDHISGLAQVLRRYEVKRVLATMVAHELSEYEEIKKLIEEKQIPVTIAKAPMRITFGDSVMEILYPFDIPDGEANEIRSNGVSIVNKVWHGKTSVLFTGDIEDAQETELVFKHIDVDADILKIAHHGSKSSSTERFLEAVSPQYAVISAGRDNRYGHPHEEVINRLEKKGISIVRTDIGGDVVFESDGMQWVLQ